MPAKKTTTIAAAEKRVIKNEISTLKKNARKILADSRHERNRIIKAQRMLDAHSRRLIKSEAREMGAINRRLSILLGRL